jgi:hypothetical protein
MFESLASSLAEDSSSITRYGYKWEAAEGGRARRWKRESLRASGRAFEDRSCAGGRTHALNKFRVSQQRNLRQRVLEIHVTRRRLQREALDILTQALGALKENC